MSSEKNDPTMAQLFEERKQLALLGVAVWERIDAECQLEPDDLVLFLPSSDTRCNTTAVKPLGEWLFRHEDASACVLCLASAAEDIRDAVEEAGAKLFLLDQGEASALMAYYLLVPGICPWFKVATLEGPNNAFSLIDELEDPSYSLEESFRRQIYIFNDMKTLSDVAEAER